MEVVAAAAIKKKSIPSSKPSKRPRQEAEIAAGAPRPSKRVKTLARKGEKEIHVISSQTTGTNTSDASPSVPVVCTPAAVSPAPTGRAPEARTDPQAATMPTAASLVETATVVVPAEPTTSLPAEETTAPAPAEPLVEGPAISEPVVAPVLEEVNRTPRRTPSKISRLPAVVLEV